MEVVREGMRECGVDEYVVSIKEGGGKYKYSTPLTWNKGEDKAKEGKDACKNDASCISKGIEILG